jgi:outer membrane murein-binding lipoprotein Lpp
MKSAMLFAGIGLSALLLAACENQAEEKVDKKAEQSLEYQDKSMGTDKQQMNQSPGAEKSNESKSNDAKSPETPQSDAKMMEVKPAPSSDNVSN